MKGLCHKCLGYEIDLVEGESERICLKCYGEYLVDRTYKQFGVTKEELEKADLKDLKKKWEAKNTK